MLELKDYAELLESALKKGKTVHQLTNVLREYRYVFITEHVLEVMKLPIKVLEEHKDFEFMVIHYPKADKYDSFLAFGIKLVGKLSEDIHIYLNGQYWKTIKLPLGRKVENFRKIKKRMVFPKELNYDERAALRKEHLSLQAKRNIAKGKQPSEFYKKWWPKVVIVEKSPEK